MGILIAAQAIMYSEWFGLLLGVYFSSMGLFSLGCASRENCFEDRCGNDQN
jgi:hypothetical protein